MEAQIDNLGKVAVTVEQDVWNVNKDYDKLTIVEAPNKEYKTYISRKPVPAGIVLTDRRYWIPFSNLKEEIVIDFNTFVNLWTNELQETNESIDELRDIIESSLAIKHVFLTEAEYQELVDEGEVEPNVLYFTTENV